MKQYAINVQGCDVCPNIVGPDEHRDEYAGYACSAARRQLPADITDIDATYPEWCPLLDSPMPGDHLGNDHMDEKQAMTEDEFAKKLVDLINEYVQSLGSIPCAVGYLRVVEGWLEVVAVRELDKADKAAKAAKAEKTDRAKAEAPTPAVEPENPA